MEKEIKKISLGHRCSICAKEIFIGDGGIIMGVARHYQCYWDEAFALGQQDYIEKGMDKELFDAGKREMLEEVKKEILSHGNCKIYHVVNGKKYSCLDCVIEFINQRLENLNHGPQKCNGGQTTSDNVGSQKNSVNGKVSASSESSAYGLQATSERSDYKTASNMETTGDVRLKSSQVVSLMNDGTPRSSNSADTNFNEFVKELKERLYQSDCMRWARTTIKDGVFDIIDELADKYHKRGKK